MYVGLADLLAVNGAEENWPLVFDARFYSYTQYMPLAPSCFSWTRCGSARALFQMLRCRGRGNDAGKPYWEPRIPHSVQQDAMALSGLESWDVPDGGDQVTTTPGTMAPQALETSEGIGLDSLDLSDDEDQVTTTSAYCVWVSLSKRTTLRPVDAVLSVMGMLNISLEPTDFRGLEFPRLAATVRLAQEYLWRGGKAYWLCRFFAQGSSNCAPSMDKRMCTMMHLPEPGRVEKVSDFISRPDVESPTPVIADCPVGSMDDQGYLEVKVPILDLAAGEQLILPDQPPKTFRVDVKMIEVGKSTGFMDANQSYISEFYHYLVLAKHMPGRWHIAASFSLDKEYGEGTFGAQTVAIGGPYPPVKLFEPGTTVQFGQESLSAETWLRRVNEADRGTEGSAARYGVF